MDNKKYSDLMENLFALITDKPGVDMCGEKSKAAFQTLSEQTETDTYFDLEELISAGFRENAYNGFCSGFQCATLLLTGRQPALE